LKKKKKGTEQTLSSSTVTMATAISTFSLHWADILVLIIYFAVVIGFGIWVSSMMERYSLYK